MAKKKRTRIGANIIVDPKNPGDMSHVGFEVWTEDGSDLSSQMILDAISDALIDQYPFSDEGDEPEPKYDA